jgi:cytochrome b6-f complex iron-sulfur subunit
MKTMGNKYVSRREFVGSIGYAGITAMAIGSLGFMDGCSKNNSPSSPGNSKPTGKQLTLDLAENTELQTVGGFKTVQLDTTPAIVFRTGDSAFTVLSLVCTHQGCTISWQSSRNRFQCPCHGSEFDSSGTVTKGPANRNLTTFTTEYQSNTDTLIIYY